MSDVERQGPILLAVGIGGVVGAEARYGVSLALPHPLATLVINVLGCLLIGVLMVGIAEVWQAHRLVRPFLGVGVLGGFTTFSTYAVDVVAPHSSMALSIGYLVATPVVSILAAWLGVSLTRLLFRRTP